jgi:hypothetical protein
MGVFYDRTQNVEVITRNETPSLAGKPGRRKEHERETNGGRSHPGGQVCC